MRKLLFAAALVVLCAVQAVAQSKLSAYTQLFVADRQARAAERANSPFAPQVRAENGRETVDCFVHFAGQIDEAVLAEYGAEIHSRFDNLGIATAAVPADALEALSADSRITLVEMGLPIRRDMNIARQTSFVDRVQAGQAPLEQSYLGRGVVVGVVDKDMQLNHPAFWNAAHDRYRIKRVWCQKKSGTHPAGFNYGTEYTDSASILNQKYDTRTMTSGHATHVTNIAAGADHTLPYWGVAGEADIVYVSDDQTSSVGLVDGVKYCLDYAQSVGKPCVVNVSMGSTLGSHDGMSTESRVLDGLVGPGRVVCGSAGNSGDIKMHCSKALSATDSVLRTFLNFRTSEYGKMAMVDIWGDVNQDYAVSMVVYNKETKQTIYRSTPVSPSRNRSFRFSPDSTVNSAHDLKFTAVLAATVNQVSNRGNISATVNYTSVPTRCGLGIEAVSTENGEVHFFCLEDLSTFSSNNQSDWSDGNSACTVDEPMGVTRGVISVGAYTTHPAYSRQTMGARADFSSMGPTTDGRIKPDISAPGQVIMSALPDLSSLTSSRGESTVVGGETFYYAGMQGTSMSSPYCTGVVATWLEANPQLDRDGVMDVFRHSSVVDEFTGSVPNNSWGLGKVNAFDGLVYILGKNVGVQDVESPEVIVAYPNPTEGEFRIAFSTTDSRVDVSVYDLGGRTVYNRTMDGVMPGSELTVSLDDAPRGAYIVRVSGRQVNSSFKIMKY